MPEKRYTLTLTGDQVYALKSAYDANFAHGLDEGEANEAERQVSKKLDRLNRKRVEDRRLADHHRKTDWRPRMSPENRERLMRRVLGQDDEET